MTTDFPFTNFAVRLSNIRLPSNLVDWTTFFEEDFSNVQVSSKGQADLQFSFCDVYKIEFDAPIIIDTVRSFSTVPFIAILFLSENLFYLLLQMGEGHSFASASSRALKIASQSFNQLGGGRFLSIANNVLISFEEDELGNYYLLSTTNKSMMEMDELFNFARQLFNGD